MATAADPSLVPRQRARQLASTFPPLLVAAERVAATVAQGVHGRRRVGQGETFWQFRRYEIGDATTAIDWRQSAKTQGVFIRENEWEAAQSVWLWRDTSPSMAYRSSNNLPTKRENAELLLLATAALLNRGGERFTLLGSGVPPSSGRASFNRLAALLQDPSKDVEGLPAAQPLPRYAHAVLIGDFLAPEDEIRQNLMGLAARGVRGHILQVLDPAEEELPFRGRIRFSGYEGERQTILNRVEVLRGRYHRRLASHREAVVNIAKSVGWTFTTHRSDLPPETALLALYMALAPRLGR